MRRGNVQFSIAVHLMTVLAYVQDRELISKQLAASINTSPSFVRRILAKLSKAGLVKATAGKKGSCVLIKKPRNITLLDVYKALGAPVIFTIHGYPVLSACPVSCHIKPAMLKIVTKLQKSLEKTLQAITLQDLVRQIKCK